jgi:hypothetical protein
MPTKPEQKKTAAGPYGGGNKYGQMTIKNEFIVVNDRPSGKFGKKADNSNEKRKERS